MSEPLAEIRASAGFSEVLSASIAAGTNPASLIGPWLERYFGARDLDGARHVIEVCAKGFGLLSLASGWAWPEIFEKSEALRNALHVTHFYALDDLHMDAGDRDGADLVLQWTIATFPAYSGPVMRLAQRYYDDGNWGAADLLLSSFLESRPGDLHACLMFARNASPGRHMSNTTATLKAGVEAGLSGEQIFAPWLETCLKAGDAQGARFALEYCAKDFELAALSAKWTWDRVLAQSAALRRALHLTAYYALDGQLMVLGDTKTASGVLAQASIAYPAYSGPVLKLVDRLKVENALGKAAKLLANFLERVPNDLYGAIAYARLQLPRRLERQRTRSLAAAVAAGVRAEALIGAWLDTYFKAGDVKSARLAVEICAAGLGLEDLEADWTWPDALQASPALGRAMHLTHFYFLDTMLVEAGKVDGADSVLRQAMATYPNLSGPVIRLAQRIFDRGNRMGAERLLSEFMLRWPDDVHAQAYLDRFAAARKSRKRGVAAHDGRELPEHVQARLAFGKKMLANGAHAERARRVLEATYDRLGFVPGPETFEVLPGIFERNAFDMQASAMFSGLLARYYGRRRNGIPATPEFGFVRGVLAFYHQHFAICARELSAYVSRFPRTRAALAAHDIVKFIDDASYGDSEYTDMLRVSEGSVDFSNCAGKKILFFSEAQPEDVEPLLRDFANAAESCVVFSHARDYSRQGPPRTRYNIPSLHVWYSREGKIVHKQLEKLCASAAREMISALPRLARTPWSTRTFLVDAGIYDYTSIDQFHRELRGAQYDKVIIITRRYSIYRTLHAMAEPVVGAENVDVSWITRPSLPAPPAFVYWPSNARLAAPFLRRQIAREQAPKHGRPIFPVLPVSGPCGPRLAMRPAVVVWSIGEANYDYAVRFVIGEILRHRPVIAIVYGDTPQRMAALQKDLATYVKASGNSVQILRYDTLLRRGASTQSDLHAQARKALGKAATIAEKEQGDGIDGPFARFEMSMAFSRSIHLDAMVGGLEWIDTVLKRCQPAFVITAPGRSAFPAMIAEYLQTHGVEAIDVHMYFLADAARQLQPPHNYAATIDTVLQDFLHDYWKMPRERMLRVGYLWQRPRLRGAQAAVLPPETAFVLDRPKVLLLATQPAPLQLSEAFVRAVLKIVAAMPDCGLMIKPHGKEVEGAIRLYNDLVNEFGLRSRCGVFDAAYPIAPFIDRADLIVLRTSNVGLEAAQSYKPVVRSVFLDRFLPQGIVDSPYAFNAKSPEELARHIDNLLNDEASRRALQEQQAAYFRDNPALLDSSGVKRLVDFAESLVAKGEGRALTCSGAPAR